MVQTIVFERSQAGAAFSRAAAIANGLKKKVKLYRANGQWIVEVCIGGNAKGTKA